MPVSAGTVQFSYTGDGTTTVFPFPSRFLTNSDIIVGIDGVQVFTGFTVTGAGDDAGGNVTFSVAPVGATAITLIRAPSINQLLDFVNNQTVLAQNIDNGLDKLTIVAQYLSYLLDRALKLDQFDTGLTGDFDVLDRRLKNVGAPIDSADAVRLTDVQDIVAAAGDVPLPTLGQIGYLMQATGAGAYGWTSRAVALGAALEAVRGLTPAADRLPYFTSGSAAALADFTAFARTLLDDADAATALLTLGVAQNFLVHPKKKAIALWQAVGDQAAATQLGFSALLAGSTGTPTPNLGTIWGRIKKMRLSAAAAVNAIVSFRSADALYSVGGVDAGFGGFEADFVWGMETGCSNPTHRAFCGMRSGISAPTDVEPSTLLNMVGMGWGAADTNIQFMKNAGAGSANKIDLGASFPVPTADNSTMYRLNMYSPPGPAQSVVYTVTNLITGATSSGTVTTNLPATSTGIGPVIQASSGGTSSVVGINLSQMYLETTL